MRMNKYVKVLYKRNIKTHIKIPIKIIELYL